MKIVIPIEKCQTIDFIFFLAFLKPINTVQKFAWQYVTYFILMNFLRKHHLLKDKEKYPTPIKFTASSTFFLTRASQHKISKIGITILSLS